MNCTALFSGICNSGRPPTGDVDREGDDLLLGPVQVAGQYAAGGEAGVGGEHHYRDGSSRLC